MSGAGRTGQSASGAGQSAGRAGQSAGRAGQSAGRAGQSAGRAGQSAGRAGQATGRAGQATGRAGQATGRAGQATGGAGQATGGAGQATGGAGQATGGAGQATGGAGQATGGAGQATGGAGQATGGAGGLTGATFSAADLAGLRARAAGLSLEAHRSSRRGRAGARLSKFRGRGMEYSESRMYLPGDDIRSIDWRVTARTGRVHTKLFHEERDRPVLFIVDLGAQMRFGTRRAFKSVVAAEAASLLAWAAVANGDRVGALVFGDGCTAESPVTGGRHGALSVFRALAGIESAADERVPGDDIGETLLRARRVARPGTLIIAISDFSTLRRPADRQLARLREHNDVLCVWIYDALEAAPPPPARYPVGDGRRTTTLDTRSSEVARAVSHRFDAIEARIESACRRTGAVLVRIRCGDDVRTVLRENLTGRASRSRRMPQ